MIPFHVCVRFHDNPAVVILNHKLQREPPAIEREPKWKPKANNEHEPEPTLARLLPDHRYLALCGDGRIHVFGRGLKLLGQIYHWSISSCVPLLDSGLVTVGSDLCVWNGQYQLVHQLANVRDMSVFYTPDDIDAYRREILNELKPFLLKDLSIIVFRYVLGL